MNTYESVWMSISQYDDILKYMIVFECKWCRWICMKVYEAILWYMNVYEGVLMSMSQCDGIWK